MFFPVVLQTGQISDLLDRALMAIYDRAARVRWFMLDIPRVHDKYD